MTDAENVTESERLDEALKQLDGVTLDAATVRAHVIRDLRMMGCVADALRKFG